MNDAEKISALEELLVKIHRNAGPRARRVTVPTLPRGPSRAAVALPQRRGALVEAEAHPIALTRVKPLARPVAPPLPRIEPRRAESRPAPAAPPPAMQLPPGLFDDDDIPLPLVLPEKKKASVVASPPVVASPAAAVVPPPLKLRPLEAKPASPPRVPGSPSSEDDMTIDIDVEELTDDDIEREWEEQARQAEVQRQAEEKAEELAREKAEAERIAQEKEQAARLAREKAEEERIAREKAEEERIARELEEAEKQAREKAEAERIAREKAEEERIARELEEAEKQAREKAEEERIARELEEAEQQAREKADAERIALENAEAARPAEHEAGPVSLDADHLANELASIVFEEPPPRTAPPEITLPAPPVIPFTTARGKLDEPREREPIEDVPASTPRPREDASRAADLAAFNDIAEPDPTDDEPPPISGAVESQRLPRRAVPAAPPTSPPPPTDVRLLVEPAPPPAPMPPSLVEAPPLLVEIAPDIVRRQPAAGPAARFIAASMAYAPSTFGDLLDASLDLGASALESVAERS